MKIAITSGGTGGHIYPGIAIADQIVRKFPQAEILFIGSEEGLERELVAKAGYRISLVKSRALLRKISYQAFSAPFITAVGFFQALIKLRNFSPRALVSTGGYASLPIVMAAKLLNIPIYLHEQNVLPGVTNRFCFRFAKIIFLSFDRSTQYVRGSVVGNPVRREIIEAERTIARKKLGYSDSDKVVLIIGGSQGARTINQAVISLLPQVKIPELKILHIAGKRDRALMEQLLGSAKYDFYQRVDYLYNISDVLAAADLVISRAGATAIAEFLVRGLPMVLIPFPYSAEGHQELNADVVVEAGAAIKINDRDLTAGKLMEVLSINKFDLSRMSSNGVKLSHPRAAEEIVNAIL